MDTGYIDSHQLSLIVGQLRRSKIDHFAVFKELGIEKYLYEIVDVDDYISIEWLFDFIEQVDNIVQDPLFFIRAGMNSHPAVYGLLGMLAMCCDNYHEVAQIADRYQKIYREAMSSDQFVSDNQFHSRLNTYRLPNHPAKEKIIELELTAIFAMSQFVTGNLYPKNPSRLEFCHYPRAPIEDYREIVGVEVRFEQTYDQIVSHPIVLAAPIYAKNSKIKRHLLKLVEQESKLKSKHQSLSEQIQIFLKNNIFNSPFSIKKVSQEFNLSATSIKRKLKEEETSFSQLCDDVRFEMTCDLLEKTEMPIEEMAEKIGYTGASSFSRAFKKWSGTTPAQYRTKNRQSA